MPMPINRNEQVGQRLAAAFASGDEAELAQAWQAVIDDVANQVREDYAEIEQRADDAALAARGYRQLTSEENAFYQRLSEALRSDHPEQVFTTVAGTDPNIMPYTVVDAVLDQLEQEHPLLSRIAFQRTGYNGLWLRDRHTAARAVWGKIDATITQELTGSIEVRNITQGKLTAFCFIPIDIIDMGYAFMDAYIRGILYEALYDGLEYGIVLGKGIDGEPVGMARDIHTGVTVSTTTGYPMKTAAAITSLKPADYNAKVAVISKTEDNRNRKMSGVVLIANQATFLSKIWPAVMVPTSTGWTKMYPYPTEEIVCNQLSDGKAILGVAEAYGFAMGGSRNGVIEFSDDFKFLEDCRTFKVLHHGAGMADDNTAFQYLDVSGLEAWSLPVYDVTPVADGE